MIGIVACFLWHFTNQTIDQLIEEIWVRCIERVMKQIDNSAADCETLRN